MTIDQRAREAAAAVRSARAEAQLTSAPPGRRSRPGRAVLAAAGALAVLLLVGIPAALLLADRGIDGPAPTAGAGQPPTEPAVGPAPPPQPDPTRAARVPTAAELDDGIRYLRTFSTLARDGLQHVFAAEQWLSPDGTATMATAASQPSPAQGDLAIDPDQAEALLAAAQLLPVGEVGEGVTPFGFADRSLPTDPAALEAALTSAPGMGGALHSPSDALSPDGSALDRRGLILRTVPPMMTPVLDPDVAAAFFTLVAGLEGADVREATDPLGRPAVEVAVPVPMFDDAGAEAGRLAYVTWFDPETRLVVGQRSELESGSFPGSGYDGPIASLFVVADRGVVDEMPTPVEPVAGEQQSPSTTVGSTGVDYVVPGGSAFGSSQIGVAGPELLALGRGNLECVEDCRALDGPRTLHLTIDPILQSELEPYMTNDRFAGRDGSAAVALVIDSSTGAVRALAGDADAVDEGLLDLAFGQQVAPGTVLLPGTMAAAVAAGLGPDTLLTPTGECGSAAPMTMTEALEAKAAPIFCQAAAEVGEDRIREMLNGTLGLPAGEQGLAVATGAEPVSIARIAALYASLANGGRRPHPHLVDRIESADGDPLGAQLFDEHQAIDGAAAATVQALLDGMAGYAGAGAAGTWHAGSAGGITTVIWAEEASTELADAWETVMSLAGVGG